MNRSDLQQLADVRIAEASALLACDPSMPDGAYNLAGYAVECALKACIAKLTNQHDWPDKSFVTKSHTHDLKVLMELAGLELARKSDAVANVAFGSNWEVVKDWSERSRYERHTFADARKFVDAIIHQTDGVLPWIKARW